jgi:hypothetical protein
LLNDASVTTRDIALAMQGVGTVEAKVVVNVGSKVTRVPSPVSTPRNAPRMSIVARRSRHPHVPRVEKRPQKGVACRVSALCRAAVTGRSGVPARAGIKRRHEAAGSTREVSR